MTLLERFESWRNSGPEKWGDLMREIAIFEAQKKDWAKRLRNATHTWPIANDIDKIISELEAEEKKA